MQRTVEKVFFALLRYEINGGELCEEMKNLITPEMLPALFKLSKRHDLAHLVGDALEKCGLLSAGTEAEKRFLQERNMAVYRYEQQRYELEQICETMENARIPFIPLKGSVLRGYYPEPWMRTSCDIDVLVSVSDLQKATEALQNALGYQREDVDSTHDVSLFAPSGVHLELHHSLAEDFCKQAVVDILERVWENNSPTDTYQKSMLSEMFYFYHISHMAKHFEIGGCGVRPFLDVYFLKRQNAYASREDTLLAQGGLLTFAEAAEETAEVWLGNVQPTSITQDVQEYILYAGMYGDIGNKAAIQQVKRGGKVRYIFSRIFIPYEELKKQYPKLERRKWLMPFYQVKRWCRLLVGKDAKNASRELKANAFLGKDKKKRIDKLLKKLEL